MTATGGERRSIAPAISEKAHSRALDQGPETDEKTPCPHAGMVNLDRLIGLSEAGTKGLSWIVREALTEPLWITRGSKVVAVVHAVRSAT